MISLALSCVKSLAFPLFQHLPFIQICLTQCSKNKFDLTPKVCKSIIAKEICDSIQYIMSDLKRA